MSTRDSLKCRRLIETPGVSDPRRSTFVIVPDPCFLLSPELLYTALTRQQDKVIVLKQGDPGQRCASSPHPARSETALLHALERRPRGRAFLPANTGVGLQQPGRYAAFLLTPIHNIWV